MKKYKLLIKIITHIIIIYSFFNLYSFRYFFKKIKSPITQGNIYKKDTETETERLPMSNQPVLSNDINFTENNTNYVFKVAENNNYYTLKNNKSVIESIIEWNTDLKRWIKIGNLNDIQDKDNFMKDKCIIENIKKKYNNSSNFKGLNLGCVFGNTMLDIHRCKVWKRNFGIGDKPYVAVLTSDKPNYNDLGTNTGTLSDPVINKTIPFIYIFFMIIILFIIMIMIKK